MRFKRNDGPALGGCKVFSRRDVNQELGRHESMNSGHPLKRVCVGLAVCCACSNSNDAPAPGDVDRNGGLYVLSAGGRCVLGARVVCGEPGGFAKTKTAGTLGVVGTKPITRSDR